MTIDLGDKYQTLLTNLIRNLHESEHFSEILPSVEKDILELLNAERLTIYHRGKNDKEIVSHHKTGTEILEIRVPLSNASVAGYVALNQSPLIIKDVYDNDALQKIDAQLKFNRNFDKKSNFRTKSMIAVPIKDKEVTLGVLQIINKRNDSVFSETDYAHANEIAAILGQKFRYDLWGTRGPWDHLIQLKKIKPEDLEEYKKRASLEGASLPHLLMSEAGITKAELGRSLERFYQVPFVSFDPSVKIPREVIEGLNDSYLQKNLWVPIEGDLKAITILIDDPTDAQKITDIQKLLRAERYSFKVGLPEDIRRFLSSSSSEGEGVINLEELVVKLQEEVQDDIPEAVETVDENAATVIQLVNKLIADAYVQRASDIHIEPGKGKTPATVRFRIDGVCRKALAIPPTHTQAVVSRIKIMSGLDIAERRKPQDGKCAVKVRGQPVELRVASLPTIQGESVVMRILSSSDPMPLEAIQMSPSNLAKVKEIISKPHGIFLVVGPTGSGKSTTLHAILGHINTPDKKIWTAEDPVEITKAGLNQIQVNPKIGLDFAAALRSFLRADPDVIMIGEMRDKETSHSAVEASLTGHLVFSTLHTNSAPETVVRLLDMGLDPVTFSDALLGVLAQRLVRTLCKACKKGSPISEEEFTLLSRYYGEEYFKELGVVPDSTNIFQPVGCAECNGTGYKGRCGIHELLYATHDVRTLIYKHSSVQDLRELAIKQGMRTLMQDGIRKLIEGATDLSEIRRVAGTTNS